MKPKLMYFDVPVGRGEECRLALHLAGVDFEDVRIKPAEWLTLKAQTPFGGIPTLEIPGQPVLGQTHAILVLIGRQHGLHPSDPMEAARHEAVMIHCEDMRSAMAPTMKLPPEERQRAREALVGTYIPAWAAASERQLAKAAPFFAGDKVNVVDLRLWAIVRWFINGSVDHIPANVFADYPKLVGVYNGVREHPRVMEWSARFAKK